MCSFNQCTFNDRCTSYQCVGTPDDCLRKDRTEKDHEDCEVCGQDHCGMKLLEDGRPSGCVVFDQAYKYTPKLVCSTFCFNKAIGVYGRFDDACNSPENAPTIYGKSCETEFVRTKDGPPRKQCGCSINGVCYPHGTPNPGNPCDGALRLACSLCCVSGLHQLSWVALNGRSASHFHPCPTIFSPLCSVRRRIRPLRLVA